MPRDSRGCFRAYRANIAGYGLKATFYACGMALKGSPGLGKAKREAARPPMLPVLNDRSTTSVRSSLR